MRRSSANERFEIDVDTPTIGLVTRISGDQPDPRAATAASNVRFFDGVATNAPGYGVLVTNPALPKTPILVVDAMLGKTGAESKSVILGTQNKIYALLRYPDDYIPV